VIELKDTKNTVNLKIPSIFDWKLVDVYCALNKKYGTRVRIGEAYGALPTGGSARPKGCLPDVDQSELIEYVDALRKIGIGFSYVINTPFVHPGQEDKEVLSTLEWLAKNNIVDITVTDHAFFDIISRHFDDNVFSITISVVAQIDSLSRITQMLNFGAKRIVVDIRGNRRISFLKSIHKSKFSDKIILLANEFCGDCSIRSRHHHMAALRDGDHPDKNISKKFPFDICVDLFTSSAKSLLKGYWILPEWMDIYQKEFGIETFKISGRTILNRNWHAAIIEAYLSQSFSGNIVELQHPVEIGGYACSLDSEKIINSGYLDFFLNNSPDCSSICGVECRFCDRLAETFL
jgi:collagenase-like PrtC family protease